MLVGALKKTVNVGRNISAKSYSQWPFLKEEHRQLIESCRSFANIELTPIAAKVDREHWFPRDAVKKLGEMGLMGMCVPIEYGGTDNYLVM
jgi:butyryl-CoA dehydrogenase